MRKKILTLLSVTLLTVALLPLDVNAVTLETIDTGSFTHTHTGSNGDCYETQQTHSHGYNCYHHCSGSSSGGGGCYGTANYHAHSGSSSSGGGCYGTANRCNRTQQGNSQQGGACPNCGRGTTVSNIYEYHSACGKGSVSKGSYTTCPSCGRISDSSKSVSTGYHTYSYSRNCGKSTSTIESYSKSCGMSDGQQTCYTATHSRVLVCASSNVGKNIGNYEIKKEMFYGFFEANTFIWHWMHSNGY